MQNSGQSTNDIWTEIQNLWNIIPFPLQIFIVFVIYVILLLITLRVLKFVLNRYKEHLTVSAYHTIYTVFRMLIIALFAAAFLNQFEQFQGSLIGLSALIGTAVGFASTQTVGNFISGIYLMIARPFTIGDYVILPKMGVEGIIKEITVNYTKILTPNGTTAIIANRSLIDTQFINTRYEIEVKEEEPTDKKENKSDSKDKDSEFDLSELKSEVSLLFRKLRTRKKVVYIYPVRFSVDVNLKQAMVNEVIKRLEKELEKEIVADVTWKVVSRTRLEVGYEINIVVENPFDLLNITNRVLNQLELYLEEVSGQ